MAMQIVAPDGTVTTCAFVAHDGASSETGDITLHMPRQVGEHVWRFVLPAHDIAGIHHDEARLALTIPDQAARAPAWRCGRCRPRSWRASGSRSRSAPSRRPAAGSPAAASKSAMRRTPWSARGTLGETPWPGTSALYWTEIELTAPAGDGTGVAVGAVRSGGAGAAA